MFKTHLLALCVFLAAGCGEHERASPGSAPDSAPGEDSNESRQPAVPEPIVIRTEMVIEGLEESTEADDVLPQADLESVPALKRWLAHTEYEKRVAAAAQLGVLGRRATDAEGALKVALEDDAGAVRVAAALAHWQVAGRGDEAVPTLQDVLVRGGSALRIEAAWALGTMGSNARPAVSQLLQMLTGKAATPAEGIDYSDGDMVVEPGYISVSERSAAAEALGQIGVKSAGVLAGLRGLASVGESYEKEAAAEALEVLKGG